MRLGDFYNQVIRLGKERDPRSRTRISSYPDTAILYGSPDKEIKKIMVGIDIEAAELLLADRLRQRQGLDLVIAHHPEGRAYASLHQVMQLQVDLLQHAGISRNVAQQLLDERMLEVERRVLPQNHTRPVDAARLLDLAFMCVHTPADNHVWHYMQDLMEKEKPRNVEDIIGILMNIKEYQTASEIYAGPRIILGSPKAKAGKVMVEMTGGTEGSRQVFDKLYKKGIRTLLCMHLSEEHFKKVKDTSLNVIIAGHISSDNLGLNLLLDRIEKQGDELFETVNSSGFARIRRN